MYKDIYSWVEEVKHLEPSKILELKRTAFNNKLSDVQAILSSGLCSRQEICKAIKDIYNLDTFYGDINSLRPIKEISLSKMLDSGYMIASSPDEPGVILVLLTDPTVKLVIQNELKNAGIQGKIKNRFILADDIESWKKKNQTEVNNTKLNAIASNINTGGAKTDDSKYKADEEEINDETIVGLVNKIIFEAANEEASDIHIEPLEENIIIRFRIDGILKIHSTIEDKRIHPQIINRIKIMAKMDTNNFLTPQSGKINMEILGKEVDMRISTLPSIYGEKVTIRILVSQNVTIRSLEELGVNAEMCDQIRYLADHPYGIIIISGPTGSGKTSSLASILTEISDVGQNIVTIEDPVEYKIKGATQVNVNEATGLTFANVLREILRQDPDIIMIGEVRDIETAKIAVTASNTGHLVFSTLHTNSAVSVIGRLIDMGVDNYMIADSLIGVINQRLVKVLCNKCKREHVINDEDVRKYKLPKRMLGKAVFEPCGCSDCNKGYTGRTIVPEILTVNNKIKEAVHNKESSQVIEQLALENGMTKQIDYAYELVLNGKTSLHEVYRLFGGVADEKNNN